MSKHFIKTDFLTATLRECWVLRDNLRASCEVADWTEQATWHAIVLESVQVPEQHRRQGHCRRLIESLTHDDRFELVIVEGVGNLLLAGALMRWGWQFDPTVMDFYHWHSAEESKP